MPKKSRGGNIGVPPPLVLFRLLIAALWNFDLFGKNAGLSVGSDAHGAEGAGFLNLQRVRVKGR